MNKNVVVFILFILLLLTIVTTSMTYKTFEGFDIYEIFQDNVVVGLYNGYTSLTTNRGGLKPFIETLRTYNNDCIVYILCEKENIFPEMSDFCRLNDVIIYSDFKSKEIVSHYRTNALRKLFAQINIWKCNKILLTDVEDVRFQGDPFDILFDTELYCAVEYGNEDINLNWMNNCKTASMNYNFSKQPVICNGTILGTAGGISKYLMFDKSNYDPNKSNCLDQGLLNIYIYYVNASYIALPCKYSRILTTPNLTSNDLRKNEDGKYINLNDEVYLIVHDNGKNVYYNM